MIRVDPELRDFIPPLSPLEEATLRASIVEEGRAIDPIVVWVAPDGSETVLDGHNRLRICTELGLPYETVKKPLPDKEAAKSWMLQHQRGRRNLKPDQDLMLRLRRGESVSQFSSLKVGKAKEVLEKAPELAADVVNGVRGVEAAWNTVQLRAGNEVSRSTLRAAPKGRIHFVVGDTQVKPGVPTDHLTWIGQYLVEQFAGEDLAVIHLGDHWDLPSLSSYDRGKKSMEGRRYLADIEAGNRALEMLTEPLTRYNKGRSRPWRPELHFLLGNHENRIQRAVETDAQLEGVLSFDQLNAKDLGWQVHEFRKPVVLDGVHYAHFFYNRGTGKPFSGENIQTRLKNIGHSFTQGHQQGKAYADRPVGDKSHHGLILGSTYLHDEEYLGPQVTCYWRGIVVCHQVEDGAYDPMFVSLDYLCRRYERQTLKEFLARKKEAA